MEWIGCCSGRIQNRAELVAVVERVRMRGRARSCGPQPQGRLSTSFGPGPVGPAEGLGTLKPLSFSWLRPSLTLSRLAAAISALSDGPQSAWTLQQAKASVGLSSSPTSPSLLPSLMGPSELWPAWLGSC